MRCILFFDLYFCDVSVLFFRILWVLVIRLLFLIGLSIDGCLLLLGLRSLSLHIFLCLFLFNDFLYTNIVFGCLPLISWGISIVVGVGVQYMLVMAHSLCGAIWHFWFIVEVVIRESDILVEAFRVNKIGSACGTIWLIVA